MILLAIFIIIIAILIIMSFIDDYNKEGYIVFAAIIAIAGITIPISVNEFSAVNLDSRYESYIKTYEDALEIYDEIVIISKDKVFLDYASGEVNKGKLELLINLRDVIADYNYDLSYKESLKESVLFGTYVIMPRKAKHISLR